MNYFVKIIDTIYPFFCAVFPVLFYYAENQNELVFSELLLPLCIIIIFAIIIRKSILYFVNKSIRANIYSALFFLYFFLYAHFEESINKYFPHFLNLLSYSGLSKSTILLLLFTAIFIVFFIVIKRKNEWEKNISIFISIFSLYFLCYTLFLLIPFQILRLQKPSIDVKPLFIEKNALSSKPDIYYIILDRYASSYELLRHFQFDNSDFIKYLEKKGFYIADKSFANYPKTHLSLGSSLNFDYLDFLVKKVGEQTGDYTPAYSIVKNSRVEKTLRSVGYKYIYFGDWWEPTRVDKDADKNINLYAHSSEFLRKFFTTTVLYPILGDFLENRKFIGFSEKRIYENIIFKFEKLGDIAKSKSPKFVFAHMLIPHYPYVFDKNCSYAEDSRPLSEDAKYIEQLKCTNKLVMRAIDEIFSKSKNTPIIILQSDEGPFKTNEMNKSGEGIDWNTTSIKARQLHMRILNAYYFPLSNEKTYESLGLYPSISPVNSFRVLFNAFFGTNLKLLPDKSYFIPHLNFPYKFFDITSQVKFD